MYPDGFMLTSQLSKFFDYWRYLMIGEFFVCFFHHHRRRRCYFVLCLFYWRMMKIVKSRTSRTVSCRL